ncbi:MAG TPA: endonuclease/exonuclease/phosphatase family protein [Cyclobacteriaceae bacterium]
MIKKLSLYLLGMFLLNGCSEEEIVKGRLVTDFSLKISSFNIRFDNPDDGFNNWNNRKLHVTSFLKNEQADVVGMQEVLLNQKQYLDTHLTDYASTGIGREDGKTKGEFAPIFYRTEIFQLVDSGTFWLSQSPAIPSIGWDAVLERICTYAVLEDRRNGRILHVYNTHFDHVGEKARIESAQLILDSINAISNKEWVILMGDLNTEPDTPPYEKIINSGFDDCFNSQTRFGPTGTFNGFNPTRSFDRRIDFIFNKGFLEQTYTSHRLIINNNFLSDHFPLIATLEYRPI